jgi:hypothetical protein
MLRLTYDQTLIEVAVGSYLYIRSLTTNKDKYIEWDKLNESYKKEIREWHTQSQRFLTRFNTSGIP